MDHCRTELAELRLGTFRYALASLVSPAPTRLGAVRLRPNDHLDGEVPHVGVRRLRSRERMPGSTQHEWRRRVNGGNGDTASRGLDQVFPLQGFR